MLEVELSLSSNLSKLIFIPWIHENTVKNEGFRFGTY